MKHVIILFSLILILSCQKKDNQNLTNLSKPNLFENKLLNDQSKNDFDANKELIEKACMNYIEGLYQGDTIKIIKSVKPTLYKFGFWKNKPTGEYESDGNMTFDQVRQYAVNVLKKKKFAKSSAPKKVEVLSIMNHIAAAKITAWWGVDYILLSKDQDNWMIEQILWEGPLEN